MRYIGEVEQFGHEYSDIFVLSDTCLGPSEGDLLCKDVNFAPSYVNHSASVFYYGDAWTIGGGISNIFDKWPPQVDSAQVLATNNTPIGYGYDLQGRSAFLTIARKF
jgi:iron complex outermembrane receptor protein